MKIALAQINTTVGDLPGNKDLILHAYRKAVNDGAELVLTPELAITGYPPRDLVHRSAFVPRNVTTLQNLAAEIGEVPLITGFIAENEGDRGRHFRNAAAVLRAGRVESVVHKTLLPTYDVFDEDRYFQAAERVLPVEISGRRIGVTVCEDIWTDEFLARPLYDRSPPRELAAMGVDLLVNISASPYHLGKVAVRRRMLGQLAKELGVPVAYCNAVGANDQLVFDGSSMLVDAQGRLTLVLPSFAEAIEVGQLSIGRGEEPVAEVPEPVVSDAEALFKALVLGTRDYVRKCGFKSCVIGLSGGIDSALVAAIAAEALGPENVHGVSMPSVYSSQGSKDDAQKLAEALGIHYQTLTIQPVYEAFERQLQPHFQGRGPDVTEENLQSRIRGVLLMALSNKHGHLLLTTGNKSEMAVGYCTIYGDMCGGLAVISDLPKTRVYEVSRWLNREREIIPWATMEKAPSAELRPDQKDQDTLPPYEVLDAILEMLIERHGSVMELVAAGFEEPTVRWIQRQIEVNEWKRHQAAPGLRVTTKAFGLGRRMPIVQRFRE